MSNKTSSLYQRYETDGDAENRGVKLTGFADGITVTVRSMRSDIVRDFQRKQQKANRQAYQANDGTLLPKQADAAVVSLLVNAVIVDWENVPDRDGNIVPFASGDARCAQILNDLPGFRERILTPAAEDETFRKAALELLKGNSSAPSEPGSTSEGASGKSPRQPKPLAK